MAKEISILLVAKDLASGNIHKVKSELGGLSSSGKIAAVGLGTASRAATGLSGALSHAKGFLTSNLGLIGASAGLFTLGGAFESGIGKAEAMGLAVEKVSAVTGEAAHEASQLVAIFGKFGVEGDGVVRMAGFAEKTLGKLANTQAKGVASAQELVLEEQRLKLQLAGHSTKLIDLEIRHQKLIDKQTKLAGSTSALVGLNMKYGLNLKKTTNLTDELSQVSALWANKSIANSEKAAVTAQLLGKSYVALLPLIKQGPKAFAEAAAEADRMGVTLKSAQDVKNVTDFIAAQRSAKEAIGGLEMQVGLMVMPDLAGAFKTFTSYVVNNRTQIVGVFHDMLGLAKQVFGAVLTIGGAFKSAWDAIPGPLRQLLITGFVGNKILKMTFGIDPIKMALGGVGNAIGGALKGLFGRGSSPATPMYVSAVGGGLGGGTGAGGKLLLGAAAIGAIAAVVATQQEISGQSTAQAIAVQQQAVDWLKQSPTAADLANGLAGVEQGINAIRSNPLNVFVQGDALAKLDEIRQAILDKQFLATTVRDSQDPNYAGVTGAGPRSTRGPVYHDTGGGKRKGGRASGGYVAPGEFTTVGEEGSEGLTTFPGGGAYVTRHAGGGTSAQSVHLTVAVHSSAREATKADSTWKRYSRPTGVGID